MKTNIIAFGGISVLVLVALAFASIFEIHLASAQVDATSSPSVSTSTSPALVASTSTALIANVASSSPANTTGSTTPAATTSLPSMSAAASPSSAVTTTATSTSPVVTTNTTTAATNTLETSTVAIEPPPQGLTLVHIVGTKYTDYFIDGTTTVAFPGDPAIDSNFNKPDAPNPTHAGLTWAHTTGDYLYDTPSGTLEVGDYAVQPDNSYIE